MATDKSSLDRRGFVKLTALGAVPALALSGSGESSHAAAPKPTRTTYEAAGGDRVRIGTIQSRSNPHSKGLATNPFSGRFRRGDLKKNVDAHLKWYEELIEQAGKDRCRLVVLTEDITRLSAAMTFLDDRSLFVDTVDWQTDRVADRLAAAAKRHGLYVVASYFAREGDAIYNVADLFAPTGDRAGRYRKVHLPEYELWQVKAGNEFPAFQTDIGWVGMLICYDQMWPESAACCAMSGAQIICQPSAAVLAEHHMQTRATDNQVHFISSTGRHSRVVSPKAEVLADAGDGNPGIAWADADINGATKPADDYFWEHLYSGIKDHKERVLKFRRPDAYGRLLEEHPPLLRQYPEGGVADTPEAIERVYAIHKEMRQRQAAGKRVPYHWHD